MTFDQMVESYYEQVAALVEAGVDILLPETSIDTLNLKACLFAIAKYFRRPANPRAGDGFGHDYRRQRSHVCPGQTVEAFWNSISHFRPAERRHQLRSRARPDAAARGRAVPTRAGLHQLPSQRRLAQRIWAVRPDAGADGPHAAASSPTTAG